MKLRRHQAWRNTEGEITYWDTLHGQRPTNISESDELLWEFEARTGEEAMSIHFLRLGCAPYRPNGAPAPCPKCGAWFYPEGYGECWQCDYEQ